MYLIEDLEKISKLTTSLSEMALGRGRWLIVSDRFRLWVQTRSPKSDLILVNGYLDDIAETKISPLSVLCASLIRTVASQGRIMTLTYFCGLHGSSRDWNDGPRGMLRCLISQFILATGARGTDLVSFPGLDHSLLQNVAAQELGALWVLFQELIGQLPPETVVFIILDGISAFETSLKGWDDEFCQIIFQLQQLVTTKPRSGPVVKILLTAPNRSIKVFWQVDSESHISLIAGNISARSMNQFELTRDIARSMEPSGP